MGGGYVYPNGTFVCVKCRNGHCCNKHEYEQKRRSEPRSRFLLSQFPVLLSPADTLLA